MRTQVANLRTLAPGWQDNRAYVYVGREGHGLSGEFGNPFLVNSSGFPTRESVIEAHRAWLWKRIQADGQFAHDVRTLAGRTLVCFCAPKACHADTLARAAEYLEHLELCYAGTTTCIHQEND